MQADIGTAPERRAEDRALLRDAVAAARQGGAVLRAMFRQRPEARVKSGLRDLVTAADLAAERVILNYLRERYPHHGWISEEAGAQSPAAPLVWVIDPLDGTSNFAHGFPHFCVSIALLDGGRSRIGVVYDPIRRELFAAVRGGGARLGRRRLAVSTVDALERAMVTTGFPYEPPAQRRAAADLTARVIERVQMLRRSGAAALDLAYVAAGRLEAHFEFGLSLHDVAAGLLLVHEAGGRAEELSLPGWRTGYLASNGTALHDEVLALHRRYLGPVEARPSALVPAASPPSPTSGRGAGGKGPSR
jgi:myo-inositol-1(or 4)-monophosphatase